MCAGIELQLLMKDLPSSLRLYIHCKMKCTNTKLSCISITIGHFPSCLCSFLKPVLVRSHSNGGKLDLHENERASETHFHMNGFAKLVLTQRKNVTRNCRITVDPHCMFISRC